jgi:hypothetical protein
MDGFIGRQKHFNPSAVCYSYFHNTSKLTPFSRFARSHPALFYLSSLFFFPLHPCLRASKPPYKRFTLYSTFPVSFASSES